MDRVTNGQGRIRRLMVTAWSVVTLRAVCWRARVLLGLLIVAKVLDLLAGR